MDRIKGMAFRKRPGMTTATVKDFLTVEDAEKWIEAQPGQRIIAIGDAEIQRGMELLGAERG